MTGWSFTALCLRALQSVTRRLYRLRGTGLPRLAEALRVAVARSVGGNPRASHVWIDDFRGASRFCCDLSDHMGSQIFFRGDYSGAQLDVLQVLLTRDSVFVDIGANQGEFTVFAAGRVPRGHVFAFEPVPSSRTRLAQNVAENGFENVTVYELGVADTPQDGVAIYMPNGPGTDGTCNSGVASLYNPGDATLKSARIRLRRLDDVLQPHQRVDVLKIDVEGAELSALRSAEATLRRERPVILFEANAQACRAAGYSVQDLWSWLASRGYRIRAISSNGVLYAAPDDTRFGNMLAFHPQGRLAADRLGALDAA